MAGVLPYHWSELPVSTPSVVVLLCTRICCQRSNLVKVPSRNTSVLPMSIRVKVEVRGNPIAKPSVQRSACVNDSAVFLSKSSPEAKDDSISSILLLEVEERSCQSSSSTYLPLSLMTVSLLEYSRSRSASLL